ncbi:VrrA/YqfQ family protein [Bacillus songklensis]|uniref:VrrA/YqfQ family protein n=1 Tax=Bacillus songklensis TaxID=1069116 RepID=A0ABV8B1A0_9BACI
MLPRRPFPPMPSRNFPAHSFFPNQAMMNRPPGGLLSRILGRGARSVPNTTNASAMGSILGNLQNAANPASLSSMMTNVQKVLKAAESVGPMVQQYGPMIKNIPAMFKIYQALKSDDISEDNTNASDSKDKTRSTSNKANKEDSNHIDELDALEAEFIEKPAKGASKPKLYI